MNGKLIGKVKNIDIFTEYGHIYLRVELGSDNNPNGNWGVQNSYPLIPGPKVKNREEWGNFPLAEYMEAAQVDYLQRLKDKPVEAIFEGNVLKDWRILTEVI